jgi:signal peptidase I
MIRSPRFRKTWRAWWPTLLLVVGLLAFRSAVADWYDVPTGSMQPTIYEGDRILVNKLAYGLRLPFTDVQLARWDDPDRGEIVVLPSPRDGTRLVKRVVAVGGDTVAMQGGVLVINGEPARYTPAAEPRWPLPEADDAAHDFLVEHAADGAHAVMFTPSTPRGRDFGPVTVPDGHVFLSGDNRDNSLDSRWFGFAPVTTVAGHATALVASVDRDRGWRPRLARFFTDLD